jgi:hypothetical protein
MSEHAGYMALSIVLAYFHTSTGAVRGAGPAPEQARSQCGVSAASGVPATGGTASDQGAVASVAALSVVAPDAQGLTCTSCVHHDENTSQNEEHQHENAPGSHCTCCTRPLLHLHGSFCAGSVQGAASGQMYGLHVRALRVGLVSEWHPPT